MQIRIGDTIIVVSGRNGKVEEVYQKVKTYNKEEARKIIRKRIIPRDGYGWGDDLIRVENEYKKLGLM